MSQQYAIGGLIGKKALTMPQGRILEAENTGYDKAIIDLVKDESISKEEAARRIKKTVGEVEAMLAKA